MPSATHPRPTQRSSAPVAPISTLAQLSPTEVAVLFADRLLPASPAGSWGGWRVACSEQKVAVQEFALLALDTLVGALVDANAIELSLRQRDGLFKSYEVAHLRLLPGVRPSVFPHQSPEARVIDWLARQPQREGWLDEAITGTLIPTEVPQPARSWNHELHKGLTARRLAHEERRQILLVFSTRTYRLTPDTLEALATVPDEDVASTLACRARLDAAQSLRCRQAWRHAVHLRQEDTSS